MILSTKQREFLYNVKYEHPYSTDSFMISRVLKNGTYSIIDKNILNDFGERYIQLNKE